MHYKTIVLQLLEDRPPLQAHLIRERQMLPALESYAASLKADHETWKERLTQASPASDPIQVASEAMELALADLRRVYPPRRTRTGRAFPST